MFSVHKSWNRGTVETISVYSGKQDKIKDFRFLDFK